MSLYLLKKTIETELRSFDLTRVETDQDHKYLAAVLVTKFLQYQLDQTLLKK
jgi:hypothetical protein